MQGREGEFGFFDGKLHELGHEHGLGSRAIADEEANLRAPFEQPSGGGILREHHIFRGVGMDRGPPAHEEARRAEVLNGLVKSLAHEIRRFLALTPGADGDTNLAALPHHIVGARPLEHDVIFGKLIAGLLRLVAEFEAGLAERELRFIDRPANDIGYNYMRPALDGLVEYEPPSPRHNPQEEERGEGPTNGPSEESETKQDDAQDRFRNAIKKYPSDWPFIGRIRYRPVPIFH